MLGARGVLALVFVAEYTNITIIMKVLQPRSSIKRHRSPDIVFAAIKTLFISLAFT